MTIEEMVFEINDRVDRDPYDARYLPGPKMSNYDIAYYCRRKGFVPVNKYDRAIEYIKKHPDLTAPELSDDLTMSECTIRKLCIKHGLPYALGRRGPKIKVA